MGQKKERERGNLKKGHNIYKPSLFQDQVRIPFQKAGSSKLNDSSLATTAQLEKDQMEPSYVLVVSPKTTTALEMA
jgi:hypothetical protein